MKITIELQKTACHEAGHAVAFVRLFDGREQGRVTIEPRGDAAGCHLAEVLSFPPTEDETPEQRATIENEAIYACAGYAALVATGYSKEEAGRGCDSDFEDAEAGSKKSLEIVKKEAVLLMSRPENMKAVARIAKELIQEKTLDADQVEILIEIEDGHTTEDEYKWYLTQSGQIGKGGKN